TSTSARGRGTNHLRGPRARASRRRCSTSRYRSTTSRPPLRAPSNSAAPRLRGSRRIGITIASASCSTLQATPSASSCTANSALRTDESLGSKQRRDMLLRNLDDVWHGRGLRVVEGEDAFGLEDPLDHEVARQHFLAIPIRASYARSSR